MNGPTMDRASLRSACIDGDGFATWPEANSSTGWAVEPRSSTAAFAVRNFGVRTVHGIVPILDATVVTGNAPADGRPALPTGLPVVTAVRMTVNLAGIDTANNRRDNDLRGRHLLDTEHHPHLIFDCTDVREGPDGWQLAGTLTAHGRSAPVTVHAALTAGPVRDLLTVRATTTFDRRALGIRAPRLMIGFEVAVEVSAQFRLIRADL